MNYKVIYADPPWRFANTATRAAAENHYDTMSDIQIRDLPVHTLSDENACLYLWTPNSFLETALEVMKRWGFNYKLPVTWCKITEGTVNARIGLGNYYRNSTEHLLFGIKGRIKPNKRNLPTFVLLPQDRHSAKPKYFYHMIEAFSDGPYVELFARSKRQDWSTWGNEVDSDIVLQQGEFVPRIIQ